MRNRNRIRIEIDNYPNINNEIVGTVFICGVEVYKTLGYKEASKVVEEINCFFSSLSNELLKTISTCKREEDNIASEITETYKNPVKGLKKLVLKFNND